MVDQSPNKNSTRVARSLTIDATIIPFLINHSRVERQPPTDNNNNLYTLIVLLLNRKSASRITSRDTLTPGLHLQQLLHQKQSIPGEGKKKNKEPGNREDKLKDERQNRNKHRRNQMRR
jgi:hypothetical protein